MMTINRNTAAQDMIRMFDNIIDHGTAAHADKLFLELKECSKDTRDEVYSLLEQRALALADKAVTTWNNLLWKEGSTLSESDYSAKRREVLRELQCLRPLAQVFYRVSQHQGKEAQPWTRAIAEEFATMNAENKNSAESLAHFFAATARVAKNKSAPAAAAPPAEVQASQDAIRQNQQRLKDICTKRKINTGMQP